MRRQRLVLPVLILLIGAGVRFHALSHAGRFHPDEAFFSTFARAAATRGAWLLPGPLDKTPLSIYASAISMTLFVDDDRPGLLDLDIHAGEFAARLPGVFAGILLVALVYPLSSGLYGKRRYGSAAALLVAFSPLAVAFSASAFTDALMLFWMVAALAAIARGWWPVAGLCLGLGFLAKQQALLYLPLVLALGWAVDTRPALGRRLLGLSLAIAACLGAFALWDTMRAQPTGVLALAAANNAPWRFLRSDELIPRLAAWLGHARWLFGPPAVTVGVVLVAAAGAVARVRLEPRRRGTAVDVLLLSYTLAYAALHWLAAFNLYDRYLLPLLPPLALLAARGLSLAARMVAPRLPIGSSSRWETALLVALAALLLPAAWSVADRQLAIGEKPDQEGIDVVARYLDSRGLGAIIYDRGLGWELDYYLGAWTDKRRVYYPTPASLVADALLQPDPAPRYFVARRADPLGRWLEALEGAGFAPERVFQAGQFVVYSLKPP